MNDLLYIDHIAGVQINDWTVQVQGIPSFVDDAWNELRAQVAEFRSSLSVERQKQNTHRKHQLERLIQDLERRPQNKDRDALITQMRNELVGLG